MQLRSLLVASAIGLSLACLAGVAGAQQIYKWKDANGVTHFAQTPPTNGTHYTKMHLTNDRDVGGNPQPSTTPVQNDDSNVATAPRQAATGGTQPNTPANHAQLCKQLSANITLLQSKQPVVTGGDNGKQQLMSDNAREQQLATTRAQQAQYCSGGGA